MQKVSSCLDGVMVPDTYLSHSTKKSKPELDSFDFQQHISTKTLLFTWSLTHDSLVNKFNADMNF